MRSETLTGFSMNSLLAKQFFNQKLSASFSASYKL